MKTPACLLPKKTGFPRAFRTLLRALVLVIALGAAVLAMTCKDGWHIDEIATLVLANGSQGGYITAYDDAKYGRGAFIQETILGESIGEMIGNVREILSDLAKNGLSGFSIREKYVAYRQESEPVWKEGTAFQEYLLADGFSFADVYINQILDTHPPLYYLFVRAAYAMYDAAGGEEISLWPAFWVNALFLLGCCGLLMRIGEKRFGSFGLGIGAALFFSLCPAGLSLAVYMRMYMALCFFVLLSLDAHLAFWQNGWKMDRRHGWYLAVSCALGFLTHYYFAIWALLTAAACFGHMCARKCPCRVWAYTGRMALGVALSLLVWPFSLVHLLLSNRSAEAVGSLSGSTAQRLLSSADIFLNHVFGTPLWVPVALAALGALLLLRRRGPLRAADSSEGCVPLVLCAAPAVVYLLVVFVISPYEDLRYMACALPAFSLLAAFCLWQLARCLPRDPSRAAACGVLCAAVALSGLGTQEPMYLYPGTAETRQFVQECEGKICVYLTSTGAAFFREMPDFVHYDKVLIVNKQELALLAQDETLQSADSFVLYIHDGYSQTDAMHAILELTGRTQYTVFAQSHLGLDARAYLIE